MSTPTARASVRRLATLFGVYVAASLLTRGVVLFADIINGDEASYVVGAREILSGHLPYLTFADNKPPLIYLYYALIQLLAGPGIAAVRVATTLVTVPLTALAVSSFYDHERRGIIAALTFLVASASFDASNMLAVNCEVVMALPLAWALVLVRNGPDIRADRAFCAGLLLGLATLVKYQGAFWLPPMVVAVVAGSPREARHGAWKDAAGIFLGYCVPIAATAAIFFVLGGFANFWYWNVTHNLGYVMNPTTVAQTATRIAARVLPFVALTAVLWYGAARSLSRAPSRYWRLLIGGVIVASIAASVLGLRFFAHYFIQLYVPLAIASAPWLADLLAAPLSLSGGWLLAGSGATLAAWTIFNAVQFVARPLDINVISHEVAARLRLMPCYDNGSLFVWGSAPTLYYHAQLPPASRFFFPESPLVRYYSGNRAATAAHRRSLVRDHRGTQWRALLADLRENEPTFILDTAPAAISMWEYFPLVDYPMLHRYVARNYDRIGDVDRIRIYQRRDCEGTQMARIPRRAVGRRRARP